MECTNGLVSWRLQLSELAFEEVHIADNRYWAADALSRIRTSGEGNTPFKGDLLLLAIVTMHNLGDTEIFVVDTFKDDVIPLQNDDTEVSLDTTPTEKQITDGTSSKHFLQTATLQIGWQGSELFLDNGGRFIYKSNTDKTTQTVVLKSIRRRKLYFWNDPPTSGHSNQRRVHDTLRQTYYWPSMAKYLQKTVTQLASCARNGNQYRHKRSFQLHSAKGPLEFVAINILDPLPKTLQENQYMLVITYRYSNLTRAKTRSKTTVSHVANMLLDHWTVLFRIFNYPFTDNEPQVVSKFFESVSIQAERKDLTTTLYHPQSNRQAKRFIKPFVICLRHYVAEIKAIRTCFSNLSHTSTIQMYNGLQKHVNLQTRTKLSTTWTLTSNKKEKRCRQRLRRYVAAGDTCKNIISNCSLDVKERDAQTPGPRKLQRRLW